MILKSQHDCDFIIFTNFYCLQHTIKLRGHIVVGHQLFSRNKFAGVLAPRCDVFYSANGDCVFTGQILRTGSKDKHILVELILWRKRTHVK